MRFLKDRETGQFKRCGFVDFMNSGSADKAVKLTGRYVMGHRMNVELPNGV